ncbi:hypothetical protein PCC8801_3556 [Rippkaea orientalis PCC 8801]|uniref:Uncharacterized protein n=1 Tax=Rippkaea orientalis (strain PCC 8801 / RF-1) TaxID=41431 RepID=B7K1H8_RIPO1|nr:hypothetical protein PCC8801_3556 [Rippkaea orientalis PCC 8801]
MITCCSVKRLIVEINQESQARFPFALLKRILNAF